MNADTWKILYQQLLALLPKGIQWHHPQPPFFTGYSYATLYDWDQYFEAITQIYCGFPIDYVLNGISILLDKQSENGFIPRSCDPGGHVYHKHAEDHVKPFLAQEILLCHHAEGVLDWLTPDRYSRLKKYLHYWFNHMARGRSGLSVWKDAGHTGMDNHFSRAGVWSRDQYFCEGVDLNSYLVREARAMAILARLLKKEKDHKQFQSMADSRAKAVREFLWNEDEGIFFDRNARTKEPIAIKYVGTFAPLWAGIATKKQARRLIENHLLNDREFWRPFPLPALAASEEGYVEGAGFGDPPGCCSWRAHTWIPTNYYTFHGLRQYGFHHVASDLTERTWTLFCRGPFSEYYTSETGIGTGLKPFWGWSCLALFFQVEQALGTDPTAITSRNKSGHRMRRWIRNTMRTQIGLRVQQTTRDVAENS